jgi:hypothetical protein
MASALLHVAPNEASGNGSPSVLKCIFITLVMRCWRAPERLFAILLCWYLQCDDLRNHGHVLSHPLIKANLDTSGSQLLHPRTADAARLPPPLSPEIPKTPTRLQSPVYLHTKRLPDSNPLSSTHDRRRKIHQKRASCSEVHYASAADTQSGPTEAPAAQPALTKKKKKARQHN